jgi:7-keto-8-aminopelargonate synthetase-like enzyme
VGLPAAALFPSCFQANVSVLSSIATKKDLILIDHYAHASLAQGAKCAGCKVRPFLHNNLEHLEAQLRSVNGFERKFIVTESVFSTEGSLAPVAEIVELSRRYGAVPVVDDSHGIGVLGLSGRGILEHTGSIDFPGIYTASLGKALANSGGVVAGPTAFIEALRYSCPGLIYSTALTPPTVAGVQAALEIVAAEFDRLSTLMWQNHRLLMSALLRQGYAATSGFAPIAVISGGATVSTLELARQFFARGILCTPFVPPSVPDSMGVLRMILGAKLSRPAVQDLLLSLPRMRAVADSPVAQRGPT